MTRAYKNIDELFLKTLDQSPVVPPVIVKAGVDSGLGFGTNSVDDLFRSELGDGIVVVPEFVKPGIDAGLGFGANGVDDLFKSELGDGNAVVPDFVKARIDANLGIGADSIDAVFQSQMTETVLVAPKFVKSKVDTALGFNRGKRRIFWFGLSVLALLLTGWGIAEMVESGGRVNTADNHGTVSGNLTGTSSETADVQNENSDNVVMDNESTGSSLVTGNQSNGQVTTNQLATGGSETTNFTNSGNAPDNKKMKVDPILNVSESPDNGADVSKDGKFSEKSTSTTDDVQNSATASPTYDNTANLSETELKVDSGSGGDGGGHNGDGGQHSIESQKDSVETLEQVDIADKSDSKTNVEKDSSKTNSETEETQSENKSTPVKKKLKSEFKPWFITATGGANLTRSFYSGSTTDEEQLYTSSMKDKVGNEFQLAANYRFKKGPMIGSGINYSSFSENFHFQDEYWLFDSVGTSDILIDSVYIDSSWTYTYDTVWTYTYDSAFVSNYDTTGTIKASYMSIPLHLGVQIPIKKFRIDLLATLRYNFLVSARGMYYDGTNFINYSSTGAAALKKGYFDMLFTGSVHYNIWKNFFISATVKYRPVFGRVYQGTTFNKKFHYTQIGIGLSYQL